MLRHYLALVESERPLLAMLAKPGFLKAVRRHMVKEQLLFDWQDADDETLMRGLQQVARTIDALGNVSASGVSVWRAELRPLEQVEEDAYGSVGRYWSWHADSAGVQNHHNAYDSYPDDDRDELVEVTFEARVRFADVDWPATLAQNLCLPGEREITVKPGARVTVTTIYAPDDERVNLVLPVERFD